jgi:hypothetical protein
MESTKFNHSKKIIILLIAMSFLISVTAAVVSARSNGGNAASVNDGAKISQSVQSSNSAITETTSTITTTATSGDSEPTQTVSSTQTSGQPGYGGYGGATP